MPESIRSVYTSQDPDYGTLVLGYFQETPFYCANLATEATTPITTDTVLLLDPPGDLNGADYIEESVTAAAGAVSADSIDETFTYLQTKGFSFAGIVTAYVNCTIDLDQTDATHGGSARLDTILVELLKYNISTGVTTQIGILTHTINKGVTGVSTLVPYAEPVLSEPFIFNVGISPKVDIGATAGYLLQMRVKIDFSAIAHASATISTIAKCRLNCYRDLSQTSQVQVAII